MKIKIKSLPKFGIILCFCIGQRIIAQTSIDPYQFTFSDKIRGQKIEVVVVQRNFDPKKHKVEDRLSDAQENPVKNSDSKEHQPGDYPFKIDDRYYPISVGSKKDLFKSREIIRFEVKWNGKAIAIDPSLYLDCYNLKLQAKAWPEDEDGNIWAVVSDDGKKVLIDTNGSSGGESYHVWWIISSDGNHQRFIDMTIP